MSTAYLSYSAGDNLGPRATSSGAAYNAPSKVDPNSLSPGEQSARNQWAIGSKVEIYSSSKGQWFPGQVGNITVDVDGEWLEVFYTVGTKTMSKEVQRNDAIVRPFMGSSPDVHLSSQDLSTLKDLGIDPNLNDDERRSLDLTMSAGHNTPGMGPDGRSAILEELQQMGYTRSEADQAATAVGNRSVNAAIDYLFAQAGSSNRADSRSMHSGTTPGGVQRKSDFAELRQQIASVRQATSLLRGDGAGATPSGPAVLPSVTAPVVSSYGCDGLDEVRSHVANINSQLGEANKLIARIESTNISGLDSGAKEVEDLKYENQILRKKLEMMERVQSDYKRSCASFEQVKRDLEQEMAGMDDIESMQEIARLNRDNAQLSAQLAESKAEQARKQSRGEEDHEEELQFLRRRHENEVMNMRLQQEVQEQELQEMRINNERYQKKINDLLQELREEKQRSNSGASRFTPGMAEKLAETHSNLKLSEVRNQQLKQKITNLENDVIVLREKETNWKQERERLEDVLQTLSNKIQRDGVLEVNINGKPLNIQQVLQQNGKLEGEVDTLSEQLRRGEKEKDRLRADLEGLKVQLDQKTREYLELFGKQSEKDTQIHYLRAEMLQLMPKRSRAQILDVIDAFNAFEDDTLVARDLTNVVRALQVPSWRIQAVVQAFFHAYSVELDDVFNKYDFVKWFEVNQSELGQLEEAAL